jgi:hypothetical protein
LRHWDPNRERSSALGEEPGPRSRYSPRTSRKSSLGAELFEQGLGVLQVGGVEALGEPVIDEGEHRAGFVATAPTIEQSHKTGRRAKFEGFGGLFARNFNRPLKTLLCFFDVRPEAPWTLD